MAILKITRNLFKILMCNSLLYFPICDKRQRLFEIPKLDRFPVVCILYLSLLSSPVKSPCGYIFVVLLYFLFYFDQYMPHPNVLHSSPLLLHPYKVFSPSFFCQTVFFFVFMFQRCFLMLSLVLRLTYIVACTNLLHIYWPSFVLNNTEPASGIVSHHFMAHSFHLTSPMWAFKFILSSIFSLNTKMVESVSWENSCEKPIFITFIFYFIFKNVIIIN